jgi:hypothetical protein
MENQVYPAWKHALLYGVIISVVLIVLLLLFYILNLYTENWPGYISYAALLGGIIISTIAYRDNYLKGFIPYGTSFSVGFLTGLFAAIFSAVLTFIFMTFVGDEYTAVILEKAEESMINSRPDITEEELARAMKFTRQFMNPVMMAVFSLLANILFGVIFALIVSIFVKKEDKSIEISA